MSVNYDTLMKLQTVLAEMFEIEDKIEEIPMDLNDKQAVLQKTKIDYLELHNKYDAINKEVDELWEKYIQAGQLREEKEKQMETTTLSRECENLLKEIEEAKGAEQNLLKNHTQKKKYLTEIEIRMQSTADIMTIQEEEVQQETEKKEVLISQQEAVLAEKKKETEELSKDLPKDLLFKFERIIRNKGGVGVVPVHGIICQGCHMELPIQFANDVRKDEEVHFCPYCSRILYYEESEEDSKIENQVHGDIANEEENVEVASDFISNDENLFED